MGVRRGAIGIGGPPCLTIRIVAAPPIAVPPHGSCTHDASLP
jgi:hypothetical protein